MGAFVLGVLIGWLIAWVFYTFWVKPSLAKDDSSSLREELELKNRQISSLQSQISASEEDSASNLENIKSTTAKASTSTKTSNKPVAAKAKSNNQSATTVKKTTSKAKTATSKSNTTATKTKSKATTKTKAQPKKTSATKKTKTTKPVAKKAAIASTKSKKSAKGVGDDFTKLSGIGPSMSATLKSLDINTFEKLAAMDDDVLRDLLDKSGAKMNNNKGVMDSWNEQATLAAKGDFAALKKMQEAMKK